MAMADEPNTDQAPQQEPTAGTQPAAEPKFTQADIDRAVKERLERERKKYADYDDLKTKAHKLDEIDAASKSEADKLAEKVAKAEQREKEALARANARILKAEIMAKAAGTFHDPEDVYLALKDKLSVGDDDTVEGLEDALKELGKAKPHWLKAADKSSPRLHAGNPGAATEGETVAQRRLRLGL
jgi:hypothetical protein